MTPQDNVQLAYVGLALHKNVVALAVEATCWTIHLSLSLGAICILCGRGLTARGPRVMLFILLLALALTTFSAMHTINIVVQSIPNLFYRHWTTTTFDERVAETQRIMIHDKLRVAGIFLSSKVGLMAQTGDAVFLWRVWMLWMRSKWWLAAPTFLYVSAVALSITSCVLYINATPTTMRFPVEQITTLSAVLCSLGSNLITTSLIAYQGYSHRKMMKNAFGNHSSRTWRMLFFLSEAGVVYLLVQTVTVAVICSNQLLFNELNEVQNTWLILAGYISVTCPAIVIIVVAYNRSLDDDSYLSDVVGDISFEPTISTSTRYDRSDEDVGEHEKHIVMSTF